MNNFQVTIIPAKNIPSTKEDVGEGGFEVQKHSKKAAGAAVESIESLEEVWDKVIEKLSNLASKATTKSSNYELNQIEFNVGIEAGLSIGLVTKGNASVSVTFTKKA